MPATTSTTIIDRLASGHSAHAMDPLPRTRVLAPVYISIYTWIYGYITNWIGLDESKGDSIESIQ